ncbi:MAG: glycosyltransferase family 4 protein [Clostridia bacterium]|nr:glycosyltransferase family 4 protein [Clostridia bacterium]
MKLLVICQYYKPEPFRVSDICEELVCRGHEVTVVTGVPNYPEGEIYPGYEKGKRRTETVNGVKIHRCFTIPRKSGALYRLLNYFSFAFSSTAFVKKLGAADGSVFDAVFVNQLSPVMMGSAALAYKKKHKVPVLLYCLDLWPESLIAGGIRRGSLIYRVFHKISAKIYRSVDRIMISSAQFSEYLQKEFEISKENIEHLPQYAECIFTPAVTTDTKTTTDLLFAGNVGTAQSVETILGAAELLQSKHPQLRWHIVGSGSDLERLQQMSKEKQLSNTVIFHGRRPLEEMPQFYQMADALLVTMKADPVLSLTLPGKVQSYMAAGRPIIAAIDGETADVINAAKCGYCSKAEDVSALAANVDAFLAEPDKKQLGDNAYAYYEKHFHQDIFFATLERNLYNSIK